MTRGLRVGRGLSGKGAGLLVGLLAMSVIPVVVGCSDDDPAVELPARWFDMATSVTSSVEIRADGSGIFSEFPLWNGGSCTADELTPYSGEFRWSWSGSGDYLQVDSPKNPVIFAPDTEVMGDVNWGELVANPCGADTPGDMRVVYLRSSMNDS